MRFVVFDEPQEERLALWRVYVFLVAIAVILRTPGWDGRSEMVTLGGNHFRVLDEPRAGGGPTSVNRKPRQGSLMVKCS